MRCTCGCETDLTVEGLAYPQGTEKSCISQTVCPGKEISPKEIDLVCMPILLEQPEIWQNGKVGSVVEFPNQSRIANVSPSRHVRILRMFLRHGRCEMHNRRARRPFPPSS